MLQEGQGGRSGGCIDVTAPWPYGSGGGRCTIQLLAACPLPDLKPKSCSGQRSSSGTSSQWACLMSPLNTTHSEHDTQLSFSTFLLWNKVNTVIFTQRGEGSWKKTKMAGFWLWWTGEEIPQLDEWAPFLQDITRLPYWTVKDSLEFS